MREPDEEEDSVPPNVDEIVDNSLANGVIADVCDVSITVRPMDSEEERLIHEFVEHGCACDFGHHQSPCCRQFSEDHYLSLKCAFSEMTHDEMDLFVMGQIMANCHQPPQSELTDKKEKHVMRFFHDGKRICQKTFLFLHNMGIKR